MNSKKVHIVFLDKGTFPKHLVFPRPATPHTWEDFHNTEEHEIIPRLQKATIVMLNKVALSGKILANLPKLKLIVLAATGSNNIDLAACRKQGIVVSNAVNYGTASVSEHVFLLLLALRRNLLPYTQNVQNGQWSKSTFFALMEHPVQELENTTLTVLGKGVLGEAVGRLARAFSMKVLYAERKNATKIRPGYTAFKEALRSCDALSIHCPLTPQTYNMITKLELNTMKPNALIINTARGGIVNEEDLAAMLSQHKIAGAAFDVLSSEPPNPNNPLLSLLSNNHNINLLLTPHMAWIGDRSLANLLKQVNQNIENFVSGKPSRVVS